MYLFIWYICVDIKMYIYIYIYIYIYGIYTAHIIILLYKFSKLQKSSILVSFGGFPHVFLKNCV